MRIKIIQVSCFLLFFFIYQHIIIVQEDILWYLHIYIYNIFQIYSLNHSPSPHFLEQFQQISFFYFHMWKQNTSTIYTLIHPVLVPTALPLVPTLEKTYFTLLAFIFLKCILINTQACIYHALIKSPPLHYLLILYALIFNSLLDAIFLTQAKYWIICSTLVRK
jgi:hypothetical protein